MATKPALHSPLPWSGHDERCIANHTISDANGVPVVLLNAVNLKPKGEDKVRDANERLVVASVNNVKRMASILSTLVRVIPRDTPGLPKEVIDTAKETLRDVEKEIGST